MKITITRSTLIMGEPAEAGDKMDLEPRLARYLISIGKAAAEDEGDMGPLETTSAEAIVETAEAPKKAPAKKRK
jgi:hypothetical protein